MIFEELYLVNSCLIFDGSFQVCSGSEGQNDHLGLISVQNYTIGQMGTVFQKSWMDSIVYLPEANLNVETTLS